MVGGVGGGPASLTGPTLFFSIPRNTISLSSLQDPIASGGEKGFSCKVVAGEGAGLAGVALYRPLDRRWERDRGKDTQGPMGGRLGSFSVQE